MRLSDRRPGRWLIAMTAAVLLFVGLAGPALAADPTPEQQAKAAAAAAGNFCKSGLLGTVLFNDTLKNGCVSAATAVLTKEGRAVTAEALCAGLAAPAGEAFGTVAKNACKVVGDKLVGLAVGFFQEALRVAGVVVDVVTFVADPTSALDNFVNTLKKSATDLVESVLKELSEATAFDPRAGWWLRHYAASAALGLMVMAVMLLITAVQTARNQLSGDEMHDTVFKQVPTGIVLMIFGPALGAVLSEFSNALTAGIITFTAEDEGAFIAKLGIFSSLSVAIPGGVILGIVIYLMLFLGALALLLGLLLQTLTLYFTGLACAIAFGMWVNPKWRKKAAKIPFTWLGILFAKPLLFLLLGAAFGLANFATSTASLTGDGIKAVVTALLAALALLVAGLAPFGLLKYAPLLPDGSDSAGGSGGGVVGGAVAGTASSVAQQIAMRRAYGNSDAASKQEASVGGGDDTAPAKNDTEQSATSDPGRRSGADQAKTGGTNAAKNGGTEAATSGGANGASSAGGQAAAQGGATTGATAGAGAGTAGAGAGAGAGTAAAAGAGAATGGIALGVIAAAEVGRAAVEKAKGIAENAPPDIPAKDGD